MAKKEFDVLVEKANKSFTEHVAWMNTLDGEEFEAALVEFNFVQKLANLAMYRKSQENTKKAQLVAPNDASSK